MKKTGLLSSSNIFYEIAAGNIKINPIDDNMIQPVSIDLRLGNEFSYLKESAVPAELHDKEKCNWIKSTTSAFVIKPQQFILACTQQYIELPLDIAVQLEGRSSVGRKGLFIHNAGWVDNGFKGNLTLELFNATNRPIILRKGTRICQAIFMYVNNPAKGYEGKYNGQTGVTCSRMYLESKGE